MRKAWSLALAPLMTLAFLTIGSGSAKAFGSEVLGCSVDTASWRSHYCTGGGGQDPNATYVIHYSPRNLSGGYVFNWSLTMSNVGSAIPITERCGATTSYPCIASGCYAGPAYSTTCDVLVKQAVYARVYAAYLELSQAGQSSTLSVGATIHKLDLGGLDKNLD
ncbi:MAG TPA: hypothetical protein VGD67_17430 [Pseudonocardiaceae bacterium]